MGDGPHLTGEWDFLAMVTDEEINEEEQEGATLESSFPLSAFFSRRNLSLLASPFQVRGGDKEKDRRRAAPLTRFFLRPDFLKNAHIFTCRACKQAGQLLCRHTRHDMRQYLSIFRRYTLMRYLSPQVLLRSYPLQSESALHRGEKYETSDMPFIRFDRSSERASEVGFRDCGTSISAGEMHRLSTI